MGLLMNSVEFNFLGIAVALSLSLANIRQHFGLEFGSQFVLGHHVLFMLPAIHASTSPS